MNRLEISVDRLWSIVMIIRLAAYGPLSTISVGPVGD